MNELELRFKDDDGSKYPDWEEKSLREIYTTITDYVAAGSFSDIAQHVQYLEDGYAQLIRAMDLKNNFSSKDFVYISKDAYDYLWRVCLDNQDGIILPNVGNCGEIYYFTPNSFPYKHNALAPNAILVRSSNNDNLFMAYRMMNSDFQKKLKLIVSPSGQTKFNKTEFKEITIKIPCLKEQKKIANLFSTLDNVIDSVQKEVDSWEQMKRGVMQKLFSQELRFKADDGTDFPEWKRTSVGDLTLSHKQGYYTDKTYVEKGIKLARVSDLFNPNINYSTMPMINISGKDYEAFKIMSGDFLIARSGSIGRYGIVDELPENIKVIFGSFLIRFRFNSKLIDNRYFGEFYDSSYAYEQLLKITQAGANININAENIKKIIVPLPCLEEQQKIADCLSEFDSVIEKTKQKLEAYKQLKKGLMQRMFV